MEETKYSHLAGEQAGGVGVMAGDEHQDAASSSMQPAVIANMHMVSHILPAFPHPTSFQKRVISEISCSFPFPVVFLLPSLTNLHP